MAATQAAIQKDIQEVIPKRILFVFYKPNYTGELITQMVAQYLRNPTPLTIKAEGPLAKQMGVMQVLDWEGHTGLDVSTKFGER